MRRLLCVLLAAGLLVGCQTRAPGSLPAPSTDAIARANDEILARYGGAYQDPQLQAYITGVGRRILAETDLSPDAVRFVVIDTDVVNAYAIPGATIYVTRGLLTWLNSEAELAGVIAHEIAHLTEDHVAEVREALRAAEQGAGTGSQGGPSADTEARLRAHSRENELEADEIGLGFLVAAGYPGDAMLSSQLQFDATEAIGRLQRGVTDPLLPPTRAMATHPSSDERIAALAALPALDTPGDDRRAAYLTAIDDLHYGPNDNDWQIVGDRVIQPVAGIEFRRPAGFSLAASAGVVSGSGPGDSALVIDFIPRGSMITPAGYLAQEFDLLQIDLLEPQLIGGFPGAVVAGSRVNDGRHWASLVGAVGVREDTLMRILAVGTIDSSDALKQGFESVLSSLQSGTEPTEIGRHIITVHTVAAGEDLGSLAAMMAVGDASSAHAADLLLALNALNRDDDLVPGQTVKLIGLAGI